MITALLNLGNTVMGLFKGKQDITQTRLQTIEEQAHSSFSIFWLSFLECVLVFLLVWNGIVVLNTNFPPIKTNFDAEELLFQLLCVTGVKHGVIYGSKIIGKMRKP